MKKVFAVPDLHFPWVYADGLTALYLAIEQHKPDIVIQLGDLYDMYAHSKFAKSQDIMTPKEEKLEARQGAEAFWKNVKICAPQAECVQLKGNHCDRPAKRLTEKYPEIANFVSFDEYFEFIGVQTIHDSRQIVEIDGVIYTHGHYTKLGDHAKYFLKPVVHGHTHRAGVLYFNQYDNMLWELDCGYMADNAAIPLQYTATKRTNWVHGYGIVSDSIPAFYPILKR